MNEVIWSFGVNDRVSETLEQENILINQSPLQFDIDVSSSFGYLCSKKAFEKEDILLFVKRIHSIVFGQNDENSIKNLQDVNDLLNERFGVCVQTDILEIIEVTFFADTNMVRLDMSYFDNVDGTDNLEVSVFLNKELVLQDNPEKLLNM